jgi:DNA-binding response OmpR family regulator/nitrogen-specific signal transduction histidine kinase
MNADLRVKEAEVKKMQELDKMKIRFFTNITHEFRTPLTLIKGPLEELRSSYPGKQEGTVNLFQVIWRNLKRLQELIGQLLDISKLETGSLGLKISKGELVELVKTVILSFLSLAEHKNIKYSYSLPESEGGEYFDADKVEKILGNLISNAFKFTPSGGEIKVNVRIMYDPENPMDKELNIRVSDTGIGIPGEKLKKIFDRFYQVENPNFNKVEGSGLGLALTKELVQLYGGIIGVESEPGKGSTFNVRLPVSVKKFREAVIVTETDKPDQKLDSDVFSQEYDEMEVEDHPRPLFSDTYKDKPLILIVEDNLDLCQYMYRILGNRYRIISAENGKAGLAIALERIPDLVISDVMMPVMDGIEMCHLLKNDERTDHIPIVILTARAGKEGKLEGLETGADDYLIKPFDKDELRARIRNLLDQRRKLKEKFKLAFLGDVPETDLPSDHLFLNKVLDLFNQHISDQDFRIPQLSEKLLLSQSQVRRKVMALSGYTPNELLRYHRLKKAAKYFRSGHKNVAQVMYMVGFNNQSYFSKCFSKLFGMTPSRFINSQKYQPSSLNA